VLLGMDPDASYEEATQPLAPGDTLLLFTDGLIEQRGESIVDVLADFVATVAPASGTGDGAAGGTEPGADPTAAEQADRILASAVSDTDDDACLVAVRIR
jgi:serine/threonine protein phosphatase PrpC